MKLKSNMNKILLLLLFILSLTGCETRNKMSDVRSYSLANLSTVSPSISIIHVNNIEDNSFKTISFNKFLDKDSFKINSKIDIKGIKFDSNTYLLDFQKDDVTGDNIADNVLLIGVKQTETFFENIKLIIQDGKSNNLAFITPSNSSGYSYSNFLGDFNGDKVKDILISINNDMVGGAGQYTFSMYSFKNDTLKTLFNNKKINKEISPNIVFMNNFKIKINYAHLDKSLNINVSKNKGNYIDDDLYDNNKLIKPIEGSADNYCGLIPKDIDNDETLELQGIQYVSGWGHADGIGLLNSVLKYNNKKKKWQLIDFDFDKF